MVSKCEYVTCGKGELKRHIKTIHDKIKDNVCDERGYETREKPNFESITDEEDNNNDDAAKETPNKDSEHPKAPRFVCHDCDFDSLDKDERNDHNK